MAAITTAAAGNWSNPATWTGGVVPGAGDTVIITKAITVDVNVTIGAANGSWVSGGNPAAIQTNNGGYVTIAAGVKLTCRGDFYVANGFHNGDPTNGLIALTMQAGSIFEFDASTGTPTNYRWFPSAASCWAAAIKINGTQANPCYFQSNAGGLPGRVSANGFASTNAVTATYTYFLRIGDGTNACYEIGANSATGLGAPAPAAIVYNFQNCTFDTCGAIKSTGTMTAAGQHALTNVRFIRSLGTNGTGTGNLTSFSYTQCNKVSFDLAPLGAGGTAVGMSLQNAYFHGHAPTTTTLTTPWQLFSDVFIRMPVVKNIYPGAGDVNGLHMVADIRDDYTGQTAPNENLNPQFIRVWAYGDQTWQDMVFENTNRGSSGDTIHCSTKCPSTVHVTVRNSLVNVNAVGDGSGTACTNMAGDATGTKIIADHQHITHAGGNTGATCNETFNADVGQIAAYKNNLHWTNPTFQAFNPNFVLGYVGGQSTGGTPVTGAIYQDIGHLQSAVGSNSNIQTDAPCLPANMDYNSCSNMPKTYTAAGNSWLTNQGRGYQAAFSSTPGVHDRSDIDPMFVDWTRTVASFDSCYMGNSFPAWSSFPSTKAFAVGDQVCNINPYYYPFTKKGPYSQGGYVNYRCIQAHLKSDGHEPGYTPTSTSTTGDWRDFWELNTFYTLRTNTATGASGPAPTYVDPSINNGDSTPMTILRVIRRWIQDGWRPQNSSLRAAGHDGSDIGAQPVKGAYQHMSMMGMG